MCEWFCPVCNSKTTTKERTYLDKNNQKQIFHACSECSSSFCGFSVFQEDALILLQKPACDLYDRTGKIIKAEIETSTGKGFCFYDFMIIVPKLNNYKYRLFRVERYAEKYPVCIRHIPIKECIKNEGVFKCNSEKEFINILNIIMNDDNVKGLILSLISMVNQKTRSSI
jgi:hypothetical protein